MTDDNTKGELEQAVEQIQQNIDNFDVLEEMAAEAERQPRLFYIYAIYQIVNLQKSLDQLLENIGNVYDNSDANMN